MHDAIRRYSEESDLYYIAGNARVSHRLDPTPDGNGVVSNAGNRLIWLNYPRDVRSGFVGTADCNGRLSTCAGQICQ